jgi:hypothetical protein
LYYGSAEYLRFIAESFYKLKSILMKTLRLLSIVSFAALLFFVACSTDEMKPPASVQEQPVNRVVLYQRSHDATSRIAETSACGAYTIALETVTQVGSNYEWVWTVVNNNPGNGNNDTYQNNSHWGMQFGSCFSWSSVVGAAYSPNGTSWTSFTPTIAVDPSQDCVTTPVFKFNYGTVGTAPSYYKLIVNTPYEVGSQFGYYKSGVRTGCCTFNFYGFGCPGTPNE